MGLILVLAACVLLAMMAPAAATTVAFNRTACQTGRETRKNCPPGTIVVGPDAVFKTVRSVILNMTEPSTPIVILIQPGVYQEQINITRTGPLTLLGVTESPNDPSANKVQVLWKAAAGPANGDGDNAFTSVLTVAPTLEASLTGSGPTGYPVPNGTKFGNENFRAYNVDFVNDFKPYSAGPSLAISVSYANAGFYYCRLQSYQDTVYVGKLGNTYMYGSQIAGQTDFLYGFGTLWIERSVLQMRSCGGGITAWKGTNTTDPNKFGVYINNSTVFKASYDLSIKGKCSLGRPWNSQHRSIFASSVLDDSIRPSGYTAWNPKEPRIDSKTFMAEYNNTGSGFNLKGRIDAKVSKILSFQDFEPYSTPSKVFTSTGWIDMTPEAS